MSSNPKQKVQKMQEFRTRAHATAPRRLNPKPDTRKNQGKVNPTFPQTALLSAYAVSMISFTIAKSPSDRTRQCHPQP